jgi:hypothetical protein
MFFGSREWPVCKADILNAISADFLHISQQHTPPQPVTGIQTKQKQTPWALVRKRSIPTERPPLVDKILVPPFVDSGMSRGQRGGSLTVVNLSFLDRSRYFFFQVAPHLSSQMLSGPHSRSTATQKMW